MYHGEFQSGRLLAMANQRAAIAAVPRNALADFIRADLRVKDIGHKVIGEQAGNRPSLSPGYDKRGVGGRAGADADIELIGETVGVTGVRIKIARENKQGLQ